MIHLEFYQQQSCPSPEYQIGGLDQVPISPHGLHVDDLEFPSSLASPDDSDASSIPYFASIFSEDPPSNIISWSACFPPAFKDYAPCEDFLNVGMEDASLLVEEENLGSQLIELDSLITEESTSSLAKSDGALNQKAPLTLPSEEMEINDQFSIFHLYKAHGEAIENGLTELADVIARRIGEKVGPLGSTMERVGHYLYVKQDDYLRQESMKNYESAFKAFYEICPYGRFAQFTANMAILEAIPDFAHTIDIIDFDTREGVQWPPLFLALSQRRELKVRLISMKRKQGHADGPLSNFDATKRRLCDYAQSVGLKLKMVEMDMEELLIEKKRMMKRGGRNEWMAFNCMVGLPHMGMESSRTDAWEFIRLAKELKNMGTNDCSSTNGIITYGNGDGVELEMGGSFGSFFEGYVLHFHALFESMEWHFPPHLSLARTSVESLFVGPYICSHACFSRWEEMHGTDGPSMKMGLEGWRLSKENLMEAKEMVREGESLYGVRIGGVNQNEMVLEWNGTPLTRISAWN